MVHRKTSKLLSLILEQHLVYIKTQDLDEGKLSTHHYPVLSCIAPLMVLSGYSRIYHRDLLYCCGEPTIDAKTILVELIH